MTITPSHLAEARDRADLTQAELASMLDVAQRTIVNWEREGGLGVPRKMEDRVRRYLGDALDEVAAADSIVKEIRAIPRESLEAGGSTLARFSDASLLRELLRRALRRQKQGGEQASDNVLDFPPIDVSGLSDAQLDALESAAGTDDTTPDED